MNWKDSELSPIIICCSYFSRVCLFLYFPSLLAHNFANNFFSFCLCLKLPSHLTIPIRTEYCTFKQRNLIQYVFFTELIVPINYT